jgi:glycosyltransferase involved in cell wall biosynthesis
MRIAFVVQRYGAEILGGSEYHCRLVAERLAARHEIDVLTTCARDYITWKNDYPEGADRIRGVTVRRFANAQTRDISAFNEYSDWIFSNPHTRDDEMRWLQMQGPWCPALLDYLKRQHRSYDAVIFFTYLYAPTVLGLEVDPSRSILVPTAHDEPAITLELYKDVFRLPAAVAYNTEVERNFLKSTFDIRAIAEEVVGCGVDLMHGDPAAGAGASAGAAPGTSLGSAPTRDDGRSAAKGADDDEDASEDVDVVAQMRSRGVPFRRRHRLSGDFLLYGGRIDAGKGCEELLEYFTSYKEQDGNASLVLMGVKLMQLPEVPWVNFAGLLSERERLQALEAATVVVVPSPFESLSLLALEAMAVGTPVLCNGRSEVLVDHCRKSNAGLYYQNRDEFIECTKLLLADERLRRAMGRNGKEYVKRNYRWDAILAKYDRLIAAAKTR